MNPLKYINDVIGMYEGDRITAQEPRNMAEGGRIGYDDGQLVQNTADGSRPGYGGPGSGVKPGHKKSEAHKEALSETKQKQGFKRYITSFDNYEGERKDIKKYNLKEWKALDASQKSQAMKKVEMKLEPGAYEGKFAELTEEQKIKKRKRTRTRYHTDPEVRTKAITKASERYYETGGAKAQYKKDMKKTKGKATLAKEKNRLLKYMEQSAFKWENPKYKQILDADGFFVGVKDLSHKIDGQYKTYVPFEQYETRYKNKKNYLPITKHRDYSNFETFFKAAKRFKMEAPDRLLGSYFKKYNKVPSYSEIYNFFERDPRSKPRAYQQNSLEIHHRALMANSPTRNLQLTLFDRNNAATGILKGYDNPDNKKLYKNLEAVDKELKRLKVRVKVGNRMLGIGEMLPEESLSDAKKQTVKIFREELKKVGTEKSRWGSQQELFDDMAKKLKLLCPKGKASGGRIGFNTAGAVLGSGANCGRNHMSNLLKNGTGTDKERNLIRQVMKASFDFAKGTGKAAVNLLNPKEFLKLKNWVGGPAIAFMAGVETLDVADRWIRQGIPIKEALGEKWTKFLMPRSLQEYQVEGMKEANALSSPASKRYAKGIELSNDLVRAYDQLEMLEKGEAAKFKKTGDAERIAELKKLIRTKEKKYYDYLYQTDEKGNVLGDGELDFKKDYNEYRATTKTGRDFTDLDIFGGMSDMGTDKMSGLKIKKDYFPMYEIGTSKIPSEQELAFDATLAKEPFVRERLVPLKQLKDFKYQNKELPTQDRINAENYFTEQGILPPRTSLSEVPLSGKGDTYDLLKDLTDDYNRIQKSKEARMYPGYEGSQFSEGGRAGYMGGGIASILKPSEIPPERGGLRSIMINDKKY